jgi:cysteine desulfurase / selenocysteine lyase
MPRLYLDNAATSFPKPPGVYEAMLEYGTKVGASPGRGHYAESREGARCIRQCRERINRLIGGESADHVAFTLNTSDALNLAIKGVVRHRRLAAPGKPITLITTAMDHNSVLRPFSALAAEGVEWVCVECDPETGMIDPKDLARVLTPQTALVAMVMASNVAGSIQPVAEVGRLCRAAGVPFLADAAQALGHVPVDVRAMNIDLLACPGHKGLLGPQGTGCLYLRPGIEDLVATTREGGTGSMSEHDEQPPTMPEKYEAGSHNTIGIVGLSVGVSWLLERGMDHVRAHELSLIRIMLEELAASGVRMAGREAINGPMSSMRLLGPSAAEQRIGVFSLVHDSIAPAEVAVILEQEFGILARSGLHCAPRAHKAMGTLSGPPHGAVRLSFGPFVTSEDVLYACRALVETCREVGANA